MKTKVVFFYFLLFKECKISRDVLAEFEDVLREKRYLAERGSRNTDFKLLEFDRLNQTPNDTYALEYRLKMLKDFILHRERRLKRKKSAKKGKIK